MSIVYKVLTKLSGETKDKGKFEKLVEVRMQNWFTENSFPCLNQPKLQMKLDFSIALSITILRRIHYFACQT